MIFLILGATIAYACSIVAFGRGPAHFNSNLFGAIVNSFGAFIPLLLYFATKTAKDGIGTDVKKGLAYALMGGVAIGVFTLFLTRIFSSGQNVSFVTPLVYGGAVLVASLAGIILFKEQYNTYTIVGMLLISAGILSMAYAAYLKGVVS